MVIPRFEKKIARWEKEIGVSPCLEVGPGVFKGNYTLEISPSPTPDIEDRQGHIIAYAYFGDALVMGLKIFRESGYQVRVDGNSKANIHIIIGPRRQNPLV